MNHAAHAFENWEDIVANLAPPMMTSNGTHCFSVKYFYKSVILPSVLSMTKKQVEAVKSDEENLYTYGNFNCHNSRKRRLWKIWQ